MTERSHPALALLADANYLRVFGVGLLANTMRWLEILVIGVYAYQESNTPFVVAAMLFIRMSPNIVFGALVGAYAERFDRRLALTIGLAASVLGMATLALLSALEVIALWHVAIGAFVSGLFWVLEYPTRRTLLGEIAGLSRLGAAMGFDSACIHATRMLGPAIGGWLFEQFGLTGPYVFGVIIYALALLALLTLRYRATDEVAPAQGVIGILRDGFAHLRGNRVLTAVLVVTMLVNFFGFSYTSMLPVIGEDKFSLSAFPIGIMASMEGAGAMLGGLLVATLSKPHHFTRIYVAGSFVFFVMIATFSVMSGFSASLPVLLVGGLGIAAFSSMQTALVFSVSPPDMRRRIMGVLVVCIGAGPLGILHTGLLAELLGADVAIRLIAFEGMVALAACLWRWPELLLHRG